MTTIEISRVDVVLLLVGLALLVALAGLANATTPAPVQLPTAPVASPVPEPPADASIASIVWRAR